jgi:hypothetical protein
MPDVPARHPARKLPGTLADARHEACLRSLTLARRCRRIRHGGCRDHRRRNFRHGVCRNFRHDVCRKCGLEDGDFRLQGLHRFRRDGCRKRGGDGKRGRHGVCREKPLRHVDRAAETRHGKCQVPRFDADVGKRFCNHYSCPMLSAGFALCPLPRQHRYNSTPRFSRNGCLTCCKQWGSKAYCPLLLALEVLCLQQVTAWVCKLLKTRHFRLQAPAPGSPLFATG